MNALYTSSSFHGSCRDFIVVFVLLIYCCSDNGFASASRSPPNIVFILADDLGWDDVGFHGSEIKTPNIDKLARQGVILNNYYVQPICTPTRAAILTGKYPIHTGLQHYVIVGSQPYGLPLKEKTLAQHLKSRGYSTHAVGKWHLGFFKKDYLPTHRGFDSHIGYYLGKEDYFNHTSDDGNMFGYDFHQNGRTLWHEDGVYSTELFSSQADAIIKSHNKTKPLFLYLAHQGVHSGNRDDPIQAPQKYVDRFPYIKNHNRRMFAGVVSALDDSVGQVYKSLQDSGLADNTILIFSTDNGGPANGMDRNAACNWPLRGGKETLWQGGVRGVGFVHSPLMKKSGYVNNNMMHVVDWLPTILSAVDNSTPSSSSPSSRLLKPEQLDGVSQWKSISNSADPSRKEVLLNIDPIEKKEGIVVGDFKLLKGRYDRGRFSGWYPPPDEARAFRLYDEYRPNLNLDFEGIFDSYMKPFDNVKRNAGVPVSGVGLDELIETMNQEYKNFVKNSHPLSDSPRHSINDDKIKVQCGPKPSNASTNCQLQFKPCLFHLASDPCEYNNLASSFPGIVAILEARLSDYRLTMIPPGNKPIDPKGNPQLHGGVWKPWM